MSKTLWIPFMVSLPYKPFVVSLSNHALGEHFSNSKPAFPRKAWFDRLTTNGIT
jgi:hypothetical protein